MDKPKSVQKIKQRILVLVFASTFLLVCTSGSTPSVRALGPAIVINSASYGTLGSFHVVKANLTSDWASSLDLVVFAVWKNTAGQTVVVSTGGITLVSVATGTIYAPLTGALARGSYTVYVFAITTSNNPVSIVTSFPIAI